MLGETECEEQEVKQYGIVGEVDMHFFKKNLSFEKKQVEHSSKLSNL